MRDIAVCDFQAHLCGGDTDGEILHDYTIAWRSCRWVSTWNGWRIFRRNFLARFGISYLPLVPVSYFQGPCTAVQVYHTFSQTSLLIPELPLEPFNCVRTQ